MNTFDEIHIKGFRRLGDVRLPLRPLNVLIAANGAGKTSLLDVFGLLATSASGNLKTRLNEMGGLPSNLSLFQGPEGQRADSLELSLTRSIKKFAPLNYSITLRPAGNLFDIAAESLTQQNDPERPKPMVHFESSEGRVRYFDPEKKKLISPVWEHDSTESALSQVTKLYREPDNFRATMASSTYYHALDVSARAPVRLPQQMRDARLPGRNGEDLVACLYWMKESEPDRYEVIIDTLKVAFPTFERLNFPPVAAGLLAMTWKEKDIRHPFYMHQLSEGTLRFLWLLTLLYSPGLTEVTLLDEPEVSLHPKLLSLLADVLREAACRTQLIVATHADRLVRFLRPEEIVAVDVEDGLATLTRGDEMELEEWLTEYSMDQIWSMGRLGGQP
jgi:predicted ATPase